MYFEKGLENFGVILKGASVQRINEVYHNFNNCFMVNNFDRNVDNDCSEWSTVHPYLSGKKIVHFVNRLDTAPLLPKHYKKLGIENVQFTKTFYDNRLKHMKRIYESYELTCNLLPEELLEYNKSFDDSYSQKHPNTGVLAIIYAAHMLRPKNLWVIGLDFYQGDYLFRRPWMAPLKQQREKMKRTNMVNHFVDVVKKNSSVNFKMITNATLPKIENLQIL